MGTRIRALCPLDIVLCVGYEPGRRDGCFAADGIQEREPAFPRAVYAVAHPSCVARRAEDCGEEGAGDERKARITGYAEVAAGGGCAGIIRADGNGLESTFGFGESPTPETAPLPKNTHVFLGIAHPAGALTFSAIYLITPTFSPGSLEALLSSRFAMPDSRRDVPSLHRLRPALHRRRRALPAAASRRRRQRLRCGVRPHPRPMLNHTIHHLHRVHGHGSVLAWAVHDTAPARGLVAWAIQLHVSIATARGVAEHGSVSHWH
ncbi:hypothetical protein B0H19DRAFT_541306 [Mycena capillaripes]|nr:hypothetical protein B0H19DRAFT_541306 [Mycena capillaripes]